MSMILCLTTISDENIDAVRAYPPLVWRLVSPDDPELFVEDTRRHRRGLFARLFGAGREPAVARDALPLREGEGVNDDLDKAWHGIHYLLTGTAHGGELPRAFLVAGGTELPGVEIGYGPARLFGSGEVKKIHEMLAAVTDADLRARFNPGEMMTLGIYPEIWDRDAADQDSLGYCAEHFATLKRVVRDAAERNLGLIVTLQ
jgi:hypothetical protein